LEITVAMPCLDEAGTLGRCIDEARALADEIVVADNGSSDGSVELARRHGARVVEVSQRGYGHACRAAVAAARGRFVILGDADGTYDFGELGRIVERLRAGAQLVLGSRFRGRIADGAMPWPHRHVGNPALTGILNLLFGAGVSDAHCGLRGVERAVWERLRLRSGGMELASEMVIRAAQERLRIEEVPVTLRRRQKPPHLRPLRDGLRHLYLMGRLSVSR
jgi:glycosyltransferase involved in cell wall biosynthesis